MTVHFIGAGPGAADLLTVRAVRLLQGSPVCLYAGTYVDAVLAHCPPDAELVDTQHLNLDEITATLVRAHAEGKDVARLCSGDPSVYSAVAEQANNTREADTYKITAIGQGQAERSAAAQQAQQLQGQLDAEYRGRKAEIDAFRTQPVERVMERLGERLKGVTIAIQPWASDAAPSRVEVEQIGAAQ